MISRVGDRTYPFPDARVGVNIDSLIRGHHAPLEVPIQLASILMHALQPDPAIARPWAFLGRLAQLDPAALTPDGGDPTARTRRGRTRGRRMILRVAAPRATNPV